MREAEIRAQRAADTKRFAMIISQLEFVMQRQQALESVLADVAKPMFEKDPEWLKKKLDAKHADLRAEQAKRDADAMEKIKEAEMKPKLTIVGSNGLH